MFDWLFGSSSAQISPAESADRQKAGAIIIDVREKSEWSGGHIAKAKHIPLGSLAGQMGSLNTNSEIIVVCQSGRRSASAAKRLQQAGFQSVKNLSGGMMNWKGQGLPVVR